MPAFQLEGVTKEFKGKLVLDIPELVIEHGCIYGIVGPSGAGKSTLLRLLNLLEIPSTGRIFFNGISTDTNTKSRLNLRRSMTMVFQKPVLFATSVLDNVTYGLTARGISKSTARREAFYALEKVGLKEFTQRNARSLSGGEAQRVALARAVVLKPKVLLLDEPTSNLDPANVAIIEKIARDLNRERGTTVMMVTHNIFQAKRLAGEIIFMYQGRAAESGPVEKIFQNPDDNRTRAFLNGEMIF
ncbi:phosphate ABC transporter ATP-binding protein [Metallumcola ferriviriculae]|uniref:Phosphate ABC transporter ATP-binding protein n=1 Tax=Metallumcola ferriviriculae TaxID=3039180 RepID=A0AAU0UNT0_9FIRM|nr:phosphate ABC transporter ATP-binding protein [Desulfitibacteraceae bacterium MK1]